MKIFQLVFDDTPKANAAREYLTAVGIATRSLREGYVIGVLERENPDWDLDSVSVWRLLRVSLTTYGMRRVETSFDD